MKLINLKNKDYIDIDDIFVINVNDNLVIEMPNFDWLRHQYQCQTCKSFFDSIVGLDLECWIVQMKDEFYSLKLLNIGHSDGKPVYYKNFISYICSYEFTGTKIKIKTEELKLTPEEVEKYAKLEKYELCHFIKEKL